MPGPWQSTGAVPNPSHSLPLLKTASQRVHLPRPPAGTGCSGQEQAGGGRRALELIGKVVGGRSEWQGARGHSSVPRHSVGAGSGRSALRQPAPSRSAVPCVGRPGLGERAEWQGWQGQKEVREWCQGGRRHILGAYWGGGLVQRAGWTGLGLKGSCPKLCFTSTTAHLHAVISPRGGRGGHKQIFQHWWCQAGAALSGLERLQK